MAAHTERIIMETFQEMLSEMPFYKIKVSALVKRCGISPNTFYYHYEDIYDLLQAWITQWLSKIPPHDDWRDTAKDFLRECKKNPAIVEHIVNYLSKEQIENTLFPANKEDDLFRVSVEKMTEGRHVSEKTIQHLANFCRYAAVGTFLQFYWEDMKLDIDETVDDLNYYLNRFVEAVVEDDSHDF